MNASCLTPEEIESRLRQAGLRVTPQRLAVARYVLCEAEHPTAEQVKAWADAHDYRMSLATVYNTLSSLVKAGLLLEVKLPHLGRTVYDDNTTDHYHFLDRRTGQLWDVNPGDVAVEPRLGRHIEIERIHVMIEGTQSRSKAQTRHRKESL